MSWIRSSKGVVLGIALVVALLAAGTAAAVTIQGQAPPPAETGETIDTTVTLEEPFRDAPDQWTLQGSTALENASWTVQVTAQGDPVDTVDSGGQEFTYDLDSETGATEVEITVRGDVPQLSSFNYEEMSAENYSAVTVSRVSDGATTELRNFRSHRYTEESREARTAIDDAIDSAGGRNDKIEQAISSYDNGNFENAVSLANEAESGAQSSQLLFIAAGVVVVLALVGGGVYYWREQRKSDYKLQ